MITFGVRSVWITLDQARGSIYINQRVNATIGVVFVVYQVFYIDDLTRF